MDFFGGYRIDSSVNLQNGLRNIAIGPYKVMLIMAGGGRIDGIK